MAPPHPRRHPLAQALMLVLLAAVAHAAPSSADIELVNPTFGPGSLPGVEASWAGPRGNVRAGTLFQYTMDPLVYREGGQEIGAAVGDRLTGQLGVSWNVTRRFSARAFIPVSDQWGADAVDTAASGFGAGDLGVGARIVAVDSDNVGVSLGGGVRFPTGTPNAWLGEDGVRGSFGPGFSLAAGPMDLLVGAAIEGRAPVSTSEDLTVGSELSGDAGVRLHLTARDAPSTFAVHLAAVGRLGLSAGGGPGELPAEAMVGAQWSPLKALQIDLGVGHGISAGYGSSRLRALLGLTYVYAPPRTAQETEPVVSAPPEVLSDEELVDAEELPAVVRPPAAPQWERGELARVEKSQIVIREPIQFEKSTAEILPSSRPMLDAIAQRLLEHTEILEVIIEGHSSEEGDFAFNYDLSVTRATAVYRALVEAGVDAQRLSTRGLGEVVPASGDASANRRVVFHIVERRAPPPPRAEGEPPPPARPKPPVTPIPWTGEKPAQKGEPALEGGATPEGGTAPGEDNQEENDQNAPGGEE